MADSRLPSATSSWALGGAAALLALLQFVPLPAGPKFLSVLNNFAHGPVFGALALIALHILRKLTRVNSRSAYLAAFAAAIVLGAAIEVLQAFSGRDPSLADLLSDALGAGAALSFWRHFEPSESASAGRVPEGRLALIAGLVLSALLLLPVGHASLGYAARYSAFPTIMQFRSRFDLYFMELRDAEAVFLRSDAGHPLSHGTHALRIRFVGTDWPGLSNVEPSPDWRAFERLRIDVTNPGHEAIVLGLRVHERGRANEYDDRFNRLFTVDANTRRILAVSLAEIASAPADRPIDLGRVGGLALFRASERPEASDVILTRMWLE
jgi:VanZ family protein